MRGYAKAGRLELDAVAGDAVPVRAGREDLAVDVSMVWQLVPATD